MSGGSGTGVLRALTFGRVPSLVEPLGRWWDRQPRSVKAAVAGVALLAAVLAPLRLSVAWQSVLFFPVAVFVLLALGLNVVVGQAGLLDLGYVAFYAVGAYTTAKLSTTAGWSSWEALAVVVVMAAVAGLVLGAPTLRLRGDYLAIVTLGFGEIARIIAKNSESLGSARGISGIPHPTQVGGVRFQLDPLPYYYLALVAIVLAIIMLLRLNRSRVGRAWAAIREDEDAAEATGVPTFRMKLWAFAIGASTGGLGGWLYASRVSFINPDNFPLFLSIILLCAVVLGGMGSMPGVILGAFAVAFLPEWLREAAAGETLTRWLNTIVGGNANDITEYRVMLFGLALVVMMIFRPQGLLPSRQRAAELTSGEATEETVEPAAEEAVAAGPQLAPEPERLEPVATAAPSSEAEPPAAPEPAPVGARPAGPDEDGTVLELRGLRAEFGGVTALNGVDLDIGRGEILGLIGPNGAGKTTLFNCVTGFIEPAGGDIRVGGRSVAGRPPYRVTRAGVARTFQNIRLFPEMTALENVMVGVDCRHRASVPGALLGSARYRREERSSRQEAARLLGQVGLGHRAGDLARNLPYGDQRRLEIARAVATGPKVLLLDEPTAGMTATEKNSIAALIRRLRESGLTVVIIEHDMGLVMGSVDRVAVLDFGQKIADGAPPEVQQDARVVEAYLGEPVAD